MNNEIILIKDKYIHDLILFMIKSPDEIIIAAINPMKIPKSSLLLRNTL